MKRGAKCPSQRQLRVGEELRHALARILGRDGLRDPELAETAFTVTEVRVSPDLKSATVFVTPLGGAALEPAAAALNRASAYLRGQLAREIDLRHVPRLAFEADRSFDAAERIASILERPTVRRDLTGPDLADPKPAGPGAEDEGDGR